MLLPAIATAIVVFVATSSPRPPLRRYGLALGGLGTMIAAAAVILLGSRNAPGGAYGPLLDQAPALRDVLEWTVWHVAVFALALGIVALMAFPAAVARLLGRGATRGGAEPRRDRRRALGLGARLGDRALGQPVRARIPARAQPLLPRAARPRLPRTLAGARPASAEGSGGPVRRGRRRGDRRAARALRRAEQRLRLPGAPAGRGPARGPPLDSAARVARGRRAARRRDLPRRAEPGRPDRVRGRRVRRPRRNGLLAGRRLDGRGAPPRVGRRGAAGIRAGAARARRPAPGGRRRRAAAGRGSSSRRWACGRSSSTRASTVSRTSTVRTRRPASRRRSSSSHRAEACS